ncbi:RecQ family ATP-dependent DNA helicase [Campylobacter corcagiensis]|uniref:DNA 3'-5' helicase n=1 Tax=Campylobacter corcagiensis TaxID=1448857 RepID=A0A7M1LFZ0_9BACT|nr:RecQ family ATP-dependent DNA helicase [Campylobacter corcagiensis]QKF64316.1 RecQ family ATP-dependent DNA helicase [Campylobacter corcagiensis]QOQ87497.1 RecQ family ATP-dependent DNA helicase [Campylobacter corcagiensis]
METIAFVDLEVGVISKRIYKIGAKFDFHEITTTSIDELCTFFDRVKPEFICGHNFINFDKIFLSNTKFNPHLKIPIIDTLYLSMLLFPCKKTHKLSKPYKTEINIENQPLGDVKETHALFSFLDDKFSSLPENLKQIYAKLLSKNEYFSGYFLYKSINFTNINIFENIKNLVHCKSDEFEILELTNPLELAFCIAFLYTDKKASFSYALLQKYPLIAKMLKILTYKQPDIYKFSKNEFGFDTFKEFEPNDPTLFNAKISQADIINSALKDESLLAVLPTGGGKTFVFLLPALIKASIYKALTIVISPLQALMKNHCDSFKEKNNNFSVKALSGYLSPVERSNILTEVANGTVDVLYIAPEALRSNSVFNAIKRRIIDRFIIDEAHCFSAWGHDFRHDYYFIAPTIKELESINEFQHKIPVSCFTATAKPEVIDDIKNYFKDFLNLNFCEFIASAIRSNLDYTAIKLDKKEEKFDTLVKEILKIGKIPTIIYLPQNALGCKTLSQKLNDDERLSELNLVIEPFYSNLDNDIENGSRTGRNKNEILDGFIKDEINIVVATTAFGMGIDKPNIGAVIHYEQSDSLESYLQESGRGARDKNIRAMCIIIYTSDEFNRSFNHLNRNKVRRAQIQAVVNFLKKRKQTIVRVSSKEIAKGIGLNLDEHEIIIKTAILELEKAGIIRRLRDKTQIFATSVSSNMDEISSTIEAKYKTLKELKEKMILIMQNIIQRSKKEPIEIYDLAEILGFKKGEVFESLNALQSENLIAFDDQISINIKNKIKAELNEHFLKEREILNFILSLPEYQKSFNVKDIYGKVAKEVIQSWTHLSKLKTNCFNASFKENICTFEISDKKTLKKIVNCRINLCEHIVEMLRVELGNQKEAEIEVALNDITGEFKFTIDGIHHTIVYLNDILDSFELRRGRLIYYKAFCIEKLEPLLNGSGVIYKDKEHYTTLKNYYARKVEALHIQLRFLDIVKNKDNELANNFIKDYFSLDYSFFKKKYKFDEKLIKLPLTKDKYEEILFDLNSEQKAVFDDKNSSAIMVLAGPGSGKTKTLVHKIASLITAEGANPEYFLMLAHSRVAVNEFRQRLKDLVGAEIMSGIKIVTFHAFALDLLDKGVKSSEELKNCIKDATKLLKDNKINFPYLEMMVIDEYQDVGKESYEFIKEIYKKMSKDRRIIAVGDDDQCIKNFGNDAANIEFIAKFKDDFSELLDDKNEIFNSYSLITNYRSMANLVKFANSFRNEFKHKLKAKDLISHQNGNADITLTKFSKNIPNLSNLIKQDKNRSIAILARTNDEVISIYSNLKEAGIKADYITSKDGFRLGNLDELRFFYDEFLVLSFEKAYQKLWQKFKNSKNLALVSLVIDKFKNDNEEYWENLEYIRAKFGEYLHSIEFEEFEKTTQKVVVTTIHKSKGKEFDSVYIVANFKPKDEYEKRLLYVGITRAKSALHIISNLEIFDKYKEFYTAKYETTNFDNESKKLVFMMGLSDIFIENSAATKNIIKSNLKAGDYVKVVKKNNKILLFKDRNLVGLLASKNGNRVSDKIEKFQLLGYSLDEEAQVEFIVRRYSEDNSYYLNPLCLISMSKLN